MFCLPRKFVPSQNTCVFCLFFCLCWRKVIQLCSCFCSFFKLNKRAKLCFLAFAFVSLTVLSHLLCHPIFPFFLLPFSLDDLFLQWQFPAAGRRQPQLSSTALSAALGVCLSLLQRRDSGNVLGSVTELQVGFFCKQRSCLKP